MKKKSPGPKFSEAALSCLTWNSLLIFILGFEGREGHEPLHLISPVILTFPSPAQTLELSRNVKACPPQRTKLCILAFRTLGLQSFSVTPFSLFFEKPDLPTPQTAFKNILLGYTALPFSLLTVPVCVPCSIEKGVEYLFSSLASPLL